MSLELDKRLLELFKKDNKATYKTCTKDGVWSLPNALKDYVIGTFYEADNLSLCEVVMSSGKVVKMEIE